LSKEFATVHASLIDISAAKQSFKVDNSFLALLHITNQCCLPIEPRRDFLPNPKRQNSLHSLLIMMRLNPRKGNKNKAQTGAAAAKVRNPAGGAKRSLRVDVVCHVYL
jgi:hypothetical protein